MTNTTYKAGFDLTEMSAAKWIEMCETNGISTVAINHKGWIWVSEKGIIITANNPITGEYYDGKREKEKDYCSYIGIEGSCEDWVFEVFDWIKWNCESYKEANFGERNYI